PKTRSSQTPPPSSTTLIMERTFLSLFGRRRCCHSTIRRRLLRLTSATVEAWAPATTGPRWPAHPRQLALQAGTGTVPAYAGQPKETTIRRTPARTRQEPVRDLRRHRESPAHRRRSRAGLRSVVPLGSDRRLPQRLRVVQPRVRPGARSARRLRGGPHPLGSRGEEAEGAEHRRVPH